MWVDVIRALVLFLLLSLSGCVGSPEPKNPVTAPGDKPGRPEVKSVSEEKATGPTLEHMKLAFADMLRAKEALEVMAPYLPPGDLKEFQEFTKKRGFILGLVLPKPKTKLKYY